MLKSLPTTSVKRRWTLPEVRWMIDHNPDYTPRYELVDGELLITPSPTPAHQRVLGQMMFALHGYLEDQGIGEVLPFLDVELEPETLVWLDVLVVSREESRRLSRDDIPVRALVLAIEILSPSSEYGDRGPKRRLYQRHVPECWLVDLDGRFVERWRRGAERPDILRERLDWMPPGATGPLVLELEEIFRKGGLGAG